MVIIVADAVQAQLALRSDHNVRGESWPDRDTMRDVT